MERGGFMDRHDDSFEEEKEEKLIREGDVLGLGGSDVPQTPADRAVGGASSDSDEVRRRRERAGLGPDADDRTTSGADDVLRHRGKGATGIDMGAGGTGTDIEPGS
jgi:hypothetical protein